MDGQRSWCQSIAHGRLPIRRLLTATSYLSPFLKYLTCNFDELELGQFKVIQGQRSWCQSIAQCRLHNAYSASIDPIVVSVTVFEIFDIKAVFIRCKPKSELNGK